MPEIISPSIRDSRIHGDSTPAAEAISQRILDLGCGSDKLPGAFGVDLDDSAEADLVWDLNKTPWPLPSGHFEHIRLKDVIEHLDDIPAIMRELWRIAAPGGLVEIRTPHYTSHYAYADPTHRHFYSLFSMDFFVEGSAMYRSSWGSRYEMVERRVDLGRIHRMLGMGVLASKAPEKYEKYFAHICPILNLHFLLRALKS